MKQPESMTGSKTVGDRHYCKEGEDSITEMEDIEVRKIQKYSIHKSITKPMNTKLIERANYSQANRELQIGQKIIHCQISTENCLIDHTIDTHVHPLVREIFPEIRNREISSAGKVKLHLQEWSRLTSDRFILNMIKGASMEFIETPYQTQSPKEYKMDKNCKELLNKEVKKLLEKKVIQKANVEKDQYVSRIFLVKQETKNRPVINFKGLNAFLHYQHFQMENMKDLRNLLQENDFMVKIDLADAYLSVPLDSKQKKYTKFKWKGELYQCLTLFFGMAKAPMYFTKLLKPVMAILRKLKIRCMIYIDDIIILAQQKTDALMARDTLIWILQALGLTINFKKSILDPKHLIEYLGLIIDSQLMKITLPQRKVNKIVEMCEKMCKIQHTTVREMSRVMGKLASTAAAVIPSPLYLRNMQRLIRKALLVNPSYEERITLDEKTKDELRWWKENIKIHNGKPLKLEKPDIVVSTDASLTGWGAHCKTVSTGGQWTSEELQSLKHINELENAAVLKAIKTFYRIHRPKSIHLRIDNMCTLYYIIKQGGKNNQTMNKITKEIWEFMLEKNCQLTAEYIPSAKNQEADFESRRMDASEWKLKVTFFNKICQKLGQPTIDLFASWATRQLQNYVSYKPDPLAMGTDAFQMNWTRMQLVYCFPPFKLIGRVLNKIKEHHISGIMITPVWETATWYPMLLEMIIEQPIILPKVPDLLLSPAGQQHPLIKEGQMRLAAWKVSGNNFKIKEFQRKLQNSCLNQEVKEQQKITSQHSRHSVAGVVQEVKIHFHAI